MVNDWMAIAVRPFVVEAKHIFRPLAGPIVSATCFTLRVSASWESSLWGPETTRLGFVQLPSAWSFGAAPMIF